MRAATKTNKKKKKQFRRRCFLCSILVASGVCRSKAVDMSEIYGHHHRHRRRRSRLTILTTRCLWNLVVASLTNLLNQRPEHGRIRKISDNFYRYLVLCVSDARVCVCCSCSYESISMVEIDINAEFENGRIGIWRLSIATDVLSLTHSLTDWHGRSWSKRKRIDESCRIAVVSQSVRVCTRVCVVQ